ncbi:AIPR family protein [Paenibacillus medicaginis]|uniref:AIPR family protein n=1 Tax=Paenibacillus medicaginis TaxID=1470560 RepID=A0ABV5C9I7_9BACL
MNKIIESFLETHVKEYSIENMKKETAFEHFINRCIINKYTLDRFDPNDVMTDEGEKGLDGVAIIINDKLVVTKDDVTSIINESNSLEVKFIFIQSKTSESFSGSEIGDFVYGVKAFFESEEKRPKTNEKMETLIEIKDIIYSHSVDFNESPTLDLFYVCCGKWNEDNGLQDRINIEIKPFKLSQDFSVVDFLPYGSEKIILTYKELKKKISRTIIMEKKVSFPKIEGVNQAYLGVVKCKDFVQILKDSDGNMLTNIFEDNVRDFQGYNSVNLEIKETIINEVDQARFAVLNNGITIMAKTIKVTGDTVELFDYQIVNGCQSSYVLFENEKYINDLSHVVVKVIEVREDVISDRVIFTTNRQTEVKSEAFTSTKHFHKRLQDFYNSIEPQFRLYYERRSKQYDLADNISKNKVVTLTTQISSYISMFLNEPHSTHRYYGELLNSYKNKIFLDSDGYEAYYVAAYFNYYLDKKIKVGTIAKKYKKFKFHLMCAMRGLHVGTQVSFGQTRKQRKEFEALFSLVKDERSMEQCLKTAIMCLDEALRSSHVPVDEHHRSKEVTTALLKQVTLYTNAKGSLEFLKIGDVVHCTVTSVSQSFINVTIKTDDSRNYGSIHISRVAKKYIENLKDEVKIGDIFQTKILNDDFYESKWGWDLSKIIE